MKAFLLVLVFTLIKSSGALQCRVCSSLLNGEQVIGVCENQGDNGNLVTCPRGHYSCYYRYDKTSKQSSKIGETYIIFLFFMKREDQYVNVKI